jgi:hypothetical protein
MNEADAEKLLRLLVDAGLPFTLVGGLAAISYGAHVGRAKDRIVEAELRAIRSAMDKAPL